MQRPLTIALSLGLAMSACTDDERPPVFQPGDVPPDVAGNTAPSAHTMAAQTHVGESLPLSDPRDFDDAERGLIARDPELRISKDGEVVWDMPSYGFIEGEPPASVNPSLWRQARLNNIHGLFEVGPGIYQLRGYDLANMSLIEGKSGWIVVDPLTTEETARAALAFARKHLGDKPVSAIIFTHSHIDHFGGALGVLTPAEIEERQVPVVAPQGFMEEATSENIIAGTTMSRRSLYMYGLRLPRNIRGHVGSGLGKGPAAGTFGILRPTVTISETPTELTIDGVRFVFQNAPESEAPAELTFYLPDSSAWCGAEIVSHTMHNLYTLRGAKVRDAIQWSRYIDEAMRRFGDAEIYFGSHHWPIWGNERILDFLKKQRDTYKFIHDQTLRLALHGYTPQEIAEALELPEPLRSSFANRGYYGTLKHNAKAVYQRYFGWYDGNPAHLDPLPAAEAGAKYVSLAGGEAAVIENAQAAYDAGEYRWAAEVLNHLVFANPGNREAKELLAHTYDQLGYQAESGPWRDVYLTGAFELRHGGPEHGQDIAAAIDLITQAPVERFLDAMAVRLNADKAEGKKMTVNLVLTDLGVTHVLELESSVLRHYERDPDPEANFTLKIAHDAYLRMMTGRLGIEDVLFGDDLEVEGNRLDLVGFFRLFDKPDGKFNIVVP